MQSIRKAAEMLQISEYKIFSEAYLNWHGGRAKEHDLNELFSRFMMFDEAPEWADVFAKSLLEDVELNRQVNLNSYSVLNMSPRVGSKKPIISFSVIK